MNELARATRAPLRHADGGSYRQLSVLYHAAMVAGLKPSPKKAQTHVFFQAGCGSTNTGPPCSTTAHPSPEWFAPLPPLRTPMHAPCASGSLLTSVLGRWRVPSNAQAAAVTQKKCERGSCGSFEPRRDATGGGEDCNAAVSEQDHLLLLRPAEAAQSRADHEPA